MAKYEIVPATWKLAQQLAVTMRAADVAEAWAGGRVSPMEALAASLETARDPGACLVDGRIVCMFGVSEWSALALLGTPWLLSTEEMPRYARRFLRKNLEYMEIIKGRYRVLINYVDARNVEAVKWLGWLGFEIDSPLPFGFDKLPFHRFHWEAA